MDNKHSLIVFAMWATVALNALLVVTSGIELIIYSKRAPGTDIDIINNIVTAIMAVATLCSAILYLRWQYSAVKFRRSQDGFSISPGWSVAYWFVPIMSLFKPYEVVKQIADSIPSAQTRHLKLWWGLWLVSNFASNVMLPRFIITTGYCGSRLLGCCGPCLYSDFPVDCVCGCAAEHDRAGFCLKPADIHSHALRGLT